MNLLLHTCCAPCSVYCIKSLRKEKIEPTLFWYNPNIHPYIEYKARRDCLREYAKTKEVELILEDQYGLDEFVCGVLKDAGASDMSADASSMGAGTSGMGASDMSADASSMGAGTSGMVTSDMDAVQAALLSRCQNYCYPKRLRKVFEYARDNGYDTVSTTLLYSIYQQHDIIRDLMEHLSREFGIDFLYRDFREGWQEGQDEAREVGLYMQKYCGCVFSEEESAFGRKLAKKLKKQGIAPTNQNVRKIIGTNGKI